ncbi:hypothetical protein AB0M87_06575 [Streptomyces sp. NPDC051320]
MRDQQDVGQAEHEDLLDAFLASVKPDEGVLHAAARPRWGRKSRLCGGR